MKNLIVLLLLSVLISCSSNEKKEDPAPVNELLNTAWRAEDEFADIIWGGDNKQFYEFLTDTEVQYHWTHNGSVRDVEKGTYTYEKPALTIVIDGETETFEVSGSLMVSKTQKVPSGGFLTYTKQ